MRKPFILMKAVVVPCSPSRTPWQHEMEGWRRSPTYCIASIWKSVGNGIVNNNIMMLIITGTIITGL